MFIFSSHSLSMLIVSWFDKEEMIQTNPVDWKILRPNSSSPWRITVMHNYYANLRTSEQTLKPNSFISGGIVAATTDTRGERTVADSQDREWN